MKNMLMMLSVLALAGCGLKGDLYLPDEADTTDGPAVEAPGADDEEDEEGAA